ncbi:helix-turn-helix domain-containing protein [Agrobacterium vitis]|uniref:Helix-turn-helix domain-containing protein n=1 Tax=Agrobacterium vitis TaxID=373 RepID=A0ABD6G8Q9_AGRVI|nr:Crp/Fnr family transcriptional regulator [Agrobacterium vitis]MUO79395.1 helix-turn-helix domain-containing protein [Agrobacterium vitis]MUO96220.1 helix-turn-helix domain-containing protein [Agrobacterium vitis]MUP05715.1 helix-turn-helix domain-containing protein [Agrobacterium vitis]MUZ82799.1 helix-turn-helix domain-containing protein [Agrobacterium vitis]MVA11825.1 helix-turn-helix domain-containing protein [Agrobacterium vitis]
MNLSSPASRLPIQIRATPVLSPQQDEKAEHIVLSPNEQYELGRMGEIIEYRTTKLEILSQGEPADFLYLLIEGVVQASHALKDGQRQIVAFYWPGDIFGLAESGLYVNSAEAVTPCSVYRFPFRKLEKFLLENPRIQQGFFVKAVHEIRTAQRHTITIGQLELPQRLAAFLVDCLDHDRYFDSESSTLSLPMSRYDIADYLGTSVESVSRTFALLEKNGLVQRKGPRKLEISMKKLIDFSGIG